MTRPNTKKDLDARQFLRRTVKDKILVEVDDSGVFLRGKIRDLGAGGMGMILPTEVDIGFLLSVAWRSKRLRGVVRHTEPVDDGILVGVEFV